AAAVATTGAGSGTGGKVASALRVVPAALRATTREGDVVPGVRPAGGCGTDCTSVPLPAAGSAPPAPDAVVAPSSALTPAACSVAGTLAAIAADVRVTEVTATPVSAGGGRAAVRNVRSWPAVCPVPLVATTR